MSTDLIEQATKNIKTMAKYYPDPAPIIPRGDVLLLKPLHEKHASYYERPSGLLGIDDSERRKIESVVGEILDVGDGILKTDGTLTPLPYSKGQYLLYHPHEAEEKTIDYRIYHLIRVSSVVGQLRERPDNVD